MAAASAGRRVEGGRDTPRIHPLTVVWKTPTRSASWAWDSPLSLSVLLSVMTNT